MICPHCHNNLPDGIEICFRCGKPLRAAPVPFNDGSGSRSRKTRAAYDPHEPADTGQRKASPAVTIAVVLALALGVVASGHFLGWYTLPFLPERESAADASDTPDHTPAASPAPSADTEALTAQDAIDLLLNGEYYMRYHNVDNEDRYVIIAFNGDSIYLGTVGADGIPLPNTEGRLFTENRVFTMDHSKKTYGESVSPVEGDLNSWGGLLATGGSGTAQFAGVALPYEEYAGGTFVERAQFFFRNEKLFGIRYDYDGVLVDILIDELTTALPDGIFEIPAGYRLAEGEASPTEPEYGAEDYITAKHILISFTGGEGGERAEADARAMAEELSAVIHSSDDPAATFGELMYAYSDDYIGFEMNPDGYTFKEGEMEDAFYQTALDLSIGEISSPVKSVYGYHIIMRLPTNASAVPAEQQGTAAEQAPPTATPRPTAKPAPSPTVKAVPSPAKQDASRVVDFVGVNGIPEYVSGRIAISKSGVVRNSRGDYECTVTFSNISGRPFSAAIEYSVYYGNDEETGITLTDDVVIDTDKSKTFSFTIKGSRVSGTCRVMFNYYWLEME